LEETAVLAPGATFTPAGPAYLLCVAGRDGSGAWMKTAEALARLLD